MHPNLTSRDACLFMCFSPHSVQASDEQIDIGSLCLAEVSVVAAQGGYVFYARVLS